MFSGNITFLNTISFNFIFMHWTIFNTVIIFFLDDQGLITCLPCSLHQCNSTLVYGLMLTCFAAFIAKFWLKGMIWPEHKCNWDTALQTICNSVHQNQNQNCFMATWKENWRTGIHCESIFYWIRPWRKLDFFKKMHLFIVRNVW